MKVVKSDLKGYYEVRKEMIRNEIFSTDLKLGRMNYYRVTHKDGDFLFSMYLNNDSKASIRFYRDYFRIPELLGSVLNELSKDYKSITIEVDENDPDTLNVIKEHTLILEETEKYYNEHKEIILKIDLVNKEYIKSKEFNIKKYNYDEYIELREEEIKTSNQYQEIKLGVTNFYKIFDDDKNLIDHFTVTTDNKQNSIYLKDNAVIIPGVLKEATKELSRDYDNVVYVTFDTSTEAIKAIKENCKSVEDITPNVINNIGLINLKINLK